MTVDEEFIETMYNGYPKDWIAIFDNAYKSGSFGLTAPRPAAHPEV